MTFTRKIILAISLALLGGGILFAVNPAAVDAVTSAVSRPLEWFSAKATVEKAWIVRETKQKHSAEQVAVINSASRIGVKLIDPQDVGPDNKTPAEYVPVLKAVDGMTLPLLVCKLSNGKYRVQSMPVPFSKLEEAVK